MKKFTIKKIKSEKIIDDKKPRVLKEDITQLYDSCEDGNFEHPITKSRTVVVSLAVAVFFGFMAGILGVILFFSGTLDFLKISLENLLPAQEFKIEHKEQVNVLEDERIFKIAEKSKGSIVSIFRKKDKSENVLDQIYSPFESSGAGFVLTADGWVVTHSKAILDTALDYVVVTSDKQILDVKNFVFDDYAEVLFLKVEAANLKTLAIKNSENLSPGERLVVFNNLDYETPKIKILRLEKENWQDNSSKNKLIKTTARSELFLKFDQNTEKSYLGSPLVDITGEICGLVVEDEGVVLGKNINDFKKAIDQILKGKNKIERVVLGAQYLELSQAIGADIKVKKGDKILVLDKGVFITEIISGSVADEAKLKKGDVIIKVGDLEINAQNNFNRLLQEYNLGDSINLTLLRPGEAEEMVVTVNF